MIDYAPRSSAAEAASIFVNQARKENMAKQKVDAGLFGKAAAARREEQQENPKKKTKI